MFNGKRRLIANGFDAHVAKAHRPQQQQGKEAEQQQKLGADFKVVEHFSVPSWL